MFNDISVCKHSEWQKQFAEKQDRPILIENVHEASLLLGEC